MMTKTTSLSKDAVRKSHGRLVKIRNYTYNADVYAFVGEREEFLSLLTDRFKVDEHEIAYMFQERLPTDGYALQLENDLLFVYLNEFHADEFYSVKVLSHEALHIACFILSSRGAYVDIGVNTECLNYLHDELFERLYIALSRKRRVKKQR